MTAAPRLLPGEICPRCDARIFRAAAQTLAARAAPGGPAPLRFGFQCPHCRAALTVTVLATAPVALHFELQEAQP